MKENNTNNKWGLISGLGFLAMIVSLFFSGVCFCISFVIFLVAMDRAIDNHS